MAQADKETIKKLTELCRIGCPEEEQEELLKDLNSMLSYIDQLQELDTSHVKPCNHVIADMNNVMRADEVGETISTKEFLDNAPEKIGGMIRIPSVIRKK